MDYIQLKKSNVLKFGIRTEDGTDTGEWLEFDLEDIELPLKINESDKMHQANVQDLKTKLFILEKKQDKKGKYILSWKEEEKIKLYKEFFIKEEKALDLFIGEGGTKKLLCGRPPYITMYGDIAELLKPVMPKIKQTAQDITEKIKGKYSTKSGDVIVTDEN